MVVRLSYSMQDALSLLKIAPRAIGSRHGYTNINPKTAQKLIERGYAAMRPDGKLEVTPQGLAAYDDAQSRTHRDR
jgi:hypothetical protein